MKKVSPALGIATLQRHKASAIRQCLNNVGKFHARKFFNVLVDLNGIRSNGCVLVYIRWTWRTNRAKQNLKQCGEITVIMPLSLIRAEKLQHFGKTKFILELSTTKLDKNQVSWRVSGAFI